MFYRSCLVARISSLTIGSLAIVSAAALAAKAPSAGPPLGLTSQVPPSITSACRHIAREEAAKSVHRVVFCPPLVPATLPQVVQTVGAADGSDGNLRSGYLVSLFSPACGAQDGSCHWTFAAAPAAVLRPWVYPPAPLVPPGQKPLKPLKPRIAHTRLAGHGVTLYRMPLHGQGDGGLYDGHIVVQWQLNGTTFQISMHGYENRPRAEAMAAALIREVGRCATSRQRRRRRVACSHVFVPLRK